MRSAPGTICPPRYSPPQKASFNSLDETCDIRTGLKFILVFVRLPGNGGGCENRLPARCHPPVGSLPAFDEYNLWRYSALTHCLLPPLSLVASRGKRLKNHFSFGLRNRFAAINHIIINRGALSDTDTNIYRIQRRQCRVGIEIIQRTLISNA